jgi:hypothetical protein
LSVPKVSHAPVRWLPSFASRWFAVSVSSVQVPKRGVAAGDGAGGRHEAEVAHGLAADAGEVGVAEAEGGVLRVVVGRVLLELGVRAELHHPEGGGRAREGGAVPVVPDRGVDEGGGVIGESRPAPRFGGGREGHHGGSREQGGKDARPRSHPFPPDNVVTFPV